MFKGFSPHHIHHAGQYWSRLSEILCLVKSFPFQVWEAMVLEIHLPINAGHILC
jgi:hypothetical protein